MAENNTEQLQTGNRDEVIESLNEKLANMELIKANLIVVQEETDELRNSLRSERVNNKLLSNNLSHLNTQSESLSEKMSETMKMLTELNTIHDATKQATNTLINIVVELCNASMSNTVTEDALYKNIDAVIKKQKEVSHEDINKCSDILNAIVESNPCLKNTGSKAITLLSTQNEEDSW